MRIRTRIIVTVLACGLLPVLTMTAFYLRTSNRSTEQISRQATTDLKQKTEAQLVAIRDLKKQEIEDYFHSIRDQVITFSNDPMIAEATRSLAAAFNDSVRSQQLEKQALLDMVAGLSNYYQSSFTSEYR